MKVNGLTFNLLHVKLMNVSEEWGKYFVGNSKTFMAYLPVHYFKHEAEDQVFSDLEL